MKKYKIIVKDKKTGTTMQDEEIHSALTKTRIVSDLKAKYRFHPNVVIISVDRIMNKGGKQLDSLDAIEEATLKVGDYITLHGVEGVVTKLEKIEYCPIAKTELYWFYNEYGLYKYNLREFISKVI